MNKFILFIFDTYYPKGGWKDYYGSYPTFEEALDEAINCIQNHRGEHYQIVNRNTLQIIKCDSKSNPTNL
jgi:hypothetical protein